MTDERDILTWDDFGTAVDALADQVRSSGFQPDVVLAVARGGVALGMGLAYALGVKNLSTVNVEFYTGVDTRLPVPIMLPPVPDAIDLAGLKVLITDDIADTGLTLQAVGAYVADHVAEARIAVVFEKERSVVRPDYSWKQTDRWVDFTWSAGSD